METITLRQLIEQAAQDGKMVGFGQWKDINCFLTYFEQHYTPILEQLHEEWKGEKDARRFFASDMLNLFK
jgi:hypothetical protein